MYTIFGQTGCVNCNNAKKLLDYMFIDYLYLNISDDHYALAELQERLPGVRTVPQIFYKDEYIGGYEELRKKVMPHSPGLET